MQFINRALVLVLFGVMMFACGGGEKPPVLQKRDIPKVLSERDPQWIYNHKCASCHGDQLEGGEEGPSLRNISKRLTDVQILEVLERGRGDKMPSKLVVGEDAFNITDWVRNYSPPRKRPGAP